MSPRSTQPRSSFEDSPVDDPDRVPTVETVLVPVDGSDESTRAVEYAIAIADRYDAGLEALYVLGEEVVRAIEQERIEGDAVAENNRAYLQTIEEMATDRDVPVSTMIAYGFSTQRKTQHPGSVVLDVAEENDADFLVIPREPQTDEPDVLEKAAEYTLLYASQPVLSV
ncbi:universal stress protein [Natranaeroarchaeum sulfidigenes]|uniref:Nucleotide-binding protein, UspA family n=1 Tax=Natranaeroarchaeum sulfidigenes TaxID=2784880 RepID=A0A897MRE3_9EURY|nr:universal stress protein [Natranaeroarchaeum sulfidigenes]QSG01549.1 Nucleotide-binding protein, UspA family [Natranaeroarchaeum sulfidigenes]